MLAVEISSSELLLRRIIGFVPVPQGLAIVLQDTEIQDGFRSMSISLVERFSQTISPFGSPTIYPSKRATDTIPLVTDHFLIQKSDI